MEDRVPKTRIPTIHTPFIATIVIAASALAVGCTAETPPVSSEPPADASPISGVYEVSGMTVDLASGSQREITGRVVLNEEGATYTATFDLDTLFPTQDGILAAEVIGQGAGSIDGRNLSGDAQTQIVISQVPGIDPGFALMPRSTTKRIVSTSFATVQTDGTVSLEIESVPAEGETYSPTRTTMRGVRVADVAIGGGQESADSPPFGEASD